MWRPSGVHGRIHPRTIVATAVLAIPIPLAAGTAVSDDVASPPTMPADESVGTVPDLAAPPPTLDAASLPAAPIVAACGHLLDAELRRIALPDRSLELEQAIRIASLGASVSIEGDWSSLHAIGIRADDRVTLPTRAGSLPVILDQVLGLLADAWDRPRLEASADGLVITSGPGAARLAGTLLHPIGDLLIPSSLPAAAPVDDVPPTAAEVGSLVRALIEPDVWAEAGGGLARMQAIDEGLLVTAPPSIQIQVRRVLDQLRLGRPHAIEASIELVEIDAETARRLETSAGPGTIAAVRAVRRTAADAVLFESNVIAEVDGAQALGACETEDLLARVELQPTWNSDRRRLRCRISVALSGPSCGGNRTLEVDQEIAVPASGLVIPLPRSGGQPPLALLLVVRAR